MQLYDGFICHPTVCAVGKSYQIMVPVKFDMILSVKVGDEEFFNHSNGIIISSAEVQRITVPMKKLDENKKYTLSVRKMIERKPYRSISEEPIEIEYSFRPLEKTENINIYQVADSHGAVDEAISAGRFFGDDIDIIVLNGDVVDSSENVELVEACYIIASGIGEGHIPCVISRGNHDMRGKIAERLAEYMPCDCGRSYYTFRIGCVWGILVDSGEDKPDDHEEYGNTICCHQFRLEQTEFIRNVIENSLSEYNAPGILYRLVISHNPFSYTIPHPFNIEKPIYTEWCRLLKENVKPDLMLCGHLHQLAISEYGSRFDKKGQPCRVLIGSRIRKRTGNTKYTGMGLTLNKDRAHVVFNSSNGKTVAQRDISYK